MKLDYDEFNVICENEPSDEILREVYAEILRAYEMKEEQR